MLGGALLVVGIATLLRSLFLAGVIQERSAMHLYRRHIIAAVVTGIVTGFVIGLTSAGSGTLIAIALIAIFRLTPQRVVGTDVFHAAILLWAAGIAHWVGGNVDFLLAGTILVGSVPGVIVGTNLSVKAPQKLLRYALAVVLIASGTTLISKEGSPGVVIPAIGVATVMIGVLFAAQAISRGRAKRRASRRRPPPRSSAHDGAASVAEDRHVVGADVRDREVLIAVAVEVDRGEPAGPSPRCARPGCRSPRRCCPGSRRRLAEALGLAVGRAADRGRVRRRRRTDARGRARRGLDER